MKNNIFFAMLIIIFSGCKEQSTSQKVSIPDYPNLQSQPVNNTYFGVTITDEYRNLENLEDSLTTKWFKAQSEHSNSVLNAISGRDELMEKMKNYDNRQDYLSWYYRITEDDQYFFLKDKSGEDAPKLYYRKHFEASDELIFDPKDFKPEAKKNYRINYIKPSWNGKHVAVAMAYDGQEISEMIVIDMDQRKPLPQIITNCWPSDGGGVSWLPDNSGLVYLHYPIIDPTSERFLKNMKSVVYKLGDDPKKLNVIFGKDTNSELNIKEEDFPIAGIKRKDDKYIYGGIGGATAYSDAYYANISDLGNKKINWKPLYKKEDKVSTTLFQGDSLIYLSAKNSNNFQIMQGPMKNRINTSNDSIIVSKENEVLNDFEITSDGIFYTTKVNGVEGKLYMISNNKETEIALPNLAGDIGISSKGKSFPDLWVSTMGWLNDYIRYKYDAATKTFTEQMITANAQYKEFENLVAKEVLVKGHNGAEIPLSIIHKKGITLDGQNPTLLYGYGSYGISYNPFFSPTLLTWVEEGGVLCFAHVRGGSEKGDSWYQNGKKKTKPNTWKDLISCTEYMIEKNYTSNRKTVINGGSAGGIGIGRAMTERPDLFAVAISKVGMMNPIRNEITPNGPNNVKEFGTMTDSLESKYLIEMDAYHHLKENQEYPATLITTGMNDPRVIPWQPGKFAAKLQQKSNSKKPILFKVDYKSGHGIGDSKESYFRSESSILAFALWQTGHPDYQLKE